MIRFKITKISWGSNDILVEGTKNALECNESFSAKTEDGSPVVIIREVFDESCHNDRWKSVRFTPKYFPSMMTVPNYETLTFIAQSDLIDDVTTDTQSDNFPSKEEFEERQSEYINYIKECFL